MPLQVVDLSFDATSPSGANVLRVVEISFDAGGNAPVLTGTVSPVGPVLAGSTVTMSVTIAGAYTGTTWTAPPSVSLAGNATTKTFTAPYTTDLSDVIVSVTATGPGGTSAVLTLTVSVLPHVDWYLSSAGVWTPLTDSTLL